ncbi:Predicted membrane protein [Actinomyces bovis]|uniref:Predicted membrane protein n=1 Tax=Actinomyces bovis TaxID=1658 RepID=A0ABY1VN90_9ACTO|nr:Bax inhibitor-1/YccA family protein [Actinomyces bovis]SPT53151.1 Predicted membrane protein [Actinomyces bovis]VEG52325.1 Predicted membrane protein [Actinomyces israelii]
MSNPFFSKNPAFNGRAAAPTTPAGYPTMPGYQVGQYGQAAPMNQYPQYGAYGTQTMQAPSQGYAEVGSEQLSALEQQYAAPSAANVDRGRMTIDDVVMRTAGIFAVILAVGAVTWSLVSTTDTRLAGLGAGAVAIGAIGALILGLVNTFKREPSPVLIMIYAVFEGAMLGGFSAIMERAYPGIVLQAVLATAATFGVMLLAYSRAGFRLSAKASKILLIAMGGYLVFSLVNFGLMLTGVVTDPWGLRGITIAGIPLGLVIGLLAVVMAALSLVLDFDAIQCGVEQGLPTRYAWAGAFGLVLTIVWMYVEFLRILAIFRED